MRPFVLLWGMRHYYVNIKPVLPPKLKPGRKAQWINTLNEADVLMDINEVAE